MIETETKNREEAFTPFGDVFAVGDQTLAYISRMRRPSKSGEPIDTDLLDGDVLRRTCLVVGKNACKDCCLKPAGTRSVEKRCSDMNLLDIVERLGIEPENVLMVGVTADKVGFYDELDSDSVTINSVGIRELPGYNAFFAKASEGVVLGARLADCGYAGLEFKDSHGEDEYGFVHLTRPNMRGDSVLGDEIEKSAKFEVGKQPAGAFEYYLHEALRHYGGDIDTVSVRLAASIEGKTFPFWFGDERFPDNTPKSYFPGWFEQGMLLNTTNPDWKPGDPLKAEDKWEPQYHEMVRHQILRSGIRPEQLEEKGIINPGIAESGHASNHHGAWANIPDARDAYLVMPRYVERKA